MVDSIPYLWLLRRRQKRQDRAGKLRQGNSLQRVSIWQRCHVGLEIRRFQIDVVSWSPFAHRRAQRGNHRLARIDWNKTGGRVFFAFRIAGPVKVVFWLSNDPRRGQLHDRRFQWTRE